MGNGAVVKDTTENIYEDGDEEDEAEYASRSDASRFVRFGRGTSMARTGFEEVGTLVRVCSNEGDGHLTRGRLSVTEEGDESRLSLLCLVFAIV